MMKTALLLYFFAWIMVIIDGKSWLAKEYPNPLKDAKKCGNTVKGPICDPDGIFSPKEKQQLIEAIGKPIETNQCSAREPQIVIAAAKEVDRNSNETKARSQQRFAFELARKFELDPICEKDIVITFGVSSKQFFAVANRNAHVIGPQISEFFKANIPLFKKENYAKAILNIIAAIQEASEETAFEESAEGLWTSVTYPNPLEEPDRCGNSRPMSVCDPDAILSLVDRENLNMFVNSLQEESKVLNSTDKCDQQGLEFLIGIADFIHVPTGLSNATAQEMFTISLVNRWKVDPTCKRGVVITMSRGNQQFYTAANTDTGVNPAELRGFFEKNMEKFKKEQFKDGIAAVIWDITRTYLDQRP